MLNKKGMEKDVLNLKNFCYVFVRHRHVFFSNKKIIDDKTVELVTRQNVFYEIHSILEVCNA